ncbi:hypothetical protein HDU85_007169 [Gaertneriomyces sp. JEL0708]|nr:hypothetical protein HDU85_007169 [Gaertneriomyces sp. JEL0708]
MDMEMTPSGLETSPKIGTASPKASSLRVLWNQAIFLATGFFTTLVTQWLHYRGAANSYSLMTVLTTYLGMVAVYFLPAQASDHATDRNIESKIAHKGVCTVAVLDVLGMAILTVGQFVVGSGLYQVIYASLIVFNAVLGRWFLRRSLNGGQWLSIFTIMFGLSINAIGKGAGPESSTENKMLVGSLITVLGTFVYSGVYTLNDYMLSNPRSYMTPRDQCFWVGVYASAICMVIMAAISLPALQSMPLNDPRVMLAYFSLILSSLGHSATYFELLESTGAVATGVLQALRAAIVFGLSHIFFCTRDSAQCFTVQKGLAAVVVVGGVIGFSVAKAKARKGKYWKVPGVGVMETHEKE